MESLAILLCVAALLIGLAIGWLLASRGVAGLRSERDRLDERAQAAALLRTTLDEVSRERDAALRELAGERAAMGERAQGFEARLTELREAKEALSAQFSEIGGKLLGDAQAKFLERADQRFAQAGEKSEAQLKALLTPVETTLKRYEEGLSKVEKDRVESYGQLKEAVSQLTVGNETVRRETARLTDVMRSSPKARGRWGEEQLRNILEIAGLSENIDFELQAVVTDGDRPLRPDCIINLPNNRCIVVDVKNVWTAFEQAFDEEDTARRGLLLDHHAGAMRSTAGELGKKGYWRKFERSPEFVIMFVPGEHVLSAAAERAPKLIEEAFRSGVVIASTINMLALAKVMAGMWRQEALAEQAQAIAEEGRKLYIGLRKVSEHVGDMGKGLNRAVSAYGSLIGTLEGSVLTHGKRLEGLKIETGGKTIESLPTVDVAVRPLTKLLAIDELPIEPNE